MISTFTICSFFLVLVNPVLKARFGVDITSGLSMGCMFSISGLAFVAKCLCIHMVLVALDWIQFG